MDVMSSEPQLDKPTSSNSCQRILLGGDENCPRLLLSPIETFVVLLMPLLGLKRSAEFRQNSSVIPVTPTG